MKVRIIPPKPVPEADKPAEPSKRLRVAAYCRVSTDMAEQENSYKSQIDYYTDYIRRQPGWENAGIFADEGLTGTRAEARPEFLKMISLCEQGRIDLVITKSISRFARNTLDCLTYIRKLKNLDIPIIFEKENINTKGEGGELLLTVMASLAQQESLSISQNVRMGIRYHFRKGKPMLNHSRFLGYTKEKGDERLTIVPEEADIVRRIYRDYLDGFTYKEIAGHLEKEGIPSPSGKQHWYDSTIRSMLQNEKYVGDLLLQKSYTASFLTGRRVKNDGDLPQYFVRNAHDPIIPREIFALVQEEIGLRAAADAKTGRIRVAGNPALNHRLFCGYCGERYHRYYNGGVRPVWRCGTRIHDRHACPGKAVTEEEIRHIILTALLSFAEHPEKLAEKLKPGKKKAGLEDFHLRSLALYAKALAKSRTEETHPYEPGETADGSCASETEKTHSPLFPSCSDMEDFLLRTTPETPATPSLPCSDAAIRRFLDRITILEFSYQVRFKGGITLTLPAEKI